MGPPQLDKLGFEIGNALGARLHGRPLTTLFVAVYAQIDLVFFVDGFVNLKPKSDGTKSGQSLVHGQRRLAEHKISRYVGRQWIFGVWI